MSLARGKFGIEYNPRQMEREPSGLRWVIVLIAIVAFASLTWNVIKRCRASCDAADARPPEPPPSVASVVESESDPSVAPDPLPAAPVIAATAYSKRPAKVRNLLMRLEEAERRRDIEMAVSTIETIRALPGSPAADIDDPLARRLGALNVRRLFNLRNAQWVKQVVVRRGDSASRIAAENGATLASLVRLNGGDISRLNVGATVYVMDHPRFNLVIRRRLRTADLSLNGKFFRRYDLTAEATGKDGAYELPEKKRAFWSRVGVSFKPEDRIELETLMPAGASVLISEM